MIDLLATSGRRSACAKVNLSLLVGPLRDDGYHDIWTVFVPVALYDEIEFALSARPVGREGGARPSLLVQCPGVAHADNLVTRALRLLEEETGFVLEGFVNVQKRIPTAAGLGGGSSDAAAAFHIGAEAITEGGGPVLGEPDIRRLARRLGADVGFFVDPRPAVGWGIGDELEFLPLPEIPLVMVLPEEELSAGEVYQTLDGVASHESAAGFQARSRFSEVSWKALSDAWVSGGLPKEAAVSQAAGLLMNDLEVACLHLLSSLRYRRDALMRQGALGAIVSGSGPTVFGVFESRGAAGQACAELRAKGLEVRQVDTLSGGAHRLDAAPALGSKGRIRRPASSPVVTRHLGRGALEVL